MDSGRCDASDRMNIQNVSCSWLCNRLQGVSILLLVACQVCVRRIKCACERTVAIQPAKCMIIRPLASDYMNNTVREGTIFVEGWGGQQLSAATLQQLLKRLLCIFETGLVR